MNNTSDLEDLQQMNQSVDARYNKVRGLDPNSNMKINDLTDGILSTQKSLHQMRSVGKRAT